MAIRVVLVEDDVAARNRFAALLGAQKDMQVVGSVGNGAEGLRAACEAQPDIVIFGLALPGGIEPLKQIHDLCVDGKIVVISASANPECVDTALRAGANGYLPDEDAAGELAEAVRAVHGGRRYFGRGISAQALEDYTRRRGPVPPVERLTPREVQVLQQLVDGKTRNDIAVALGISPKSVDTYKSRLMLKLEIDNLPTLVKFAIRSRLTRL